MKFILKETYKFYTNGIKTIKIKDGDTIPDGFKPGRTFKSNPWNKGLTKDNSEKVKLNAMHSAATRKINNSYAPWNKGLTKDTDERMSNIAKKVSKSTQGRTPWNKGIPMSTETRKKASEAHMGKTPWNKGLTKETNTSIESTSKKLKGHKCFVTDWDEAKRKEYKTRKLNGTFNSSQPEQDLINNLIEIYGEKDVIHPYRDARYPYNCDAYIKSLDLFIEYHGTWEHGGHPFNPNSEKDMQTLENWTEKSKTSKRYEYAIYYWTKLDVQKLNTFRQNKLNFKIIYPNNITITK